MALKGIMVIHFLHFLAEGSGVIGACQGYFDPARGGVFARNVSGHI